MEQATFQGGYLPRVITIKESEVKAKEMASRLEEWKKRGRGEEVRRWWYRLSNKRWVGLTIQSFWLDIELWLLGVER